ncbi:MAG: hypothetical protein EOP49_25985 [Sphingobacteriales bacterium]|nr:MAG: hypothetical protein EOP49_25985 [Sphingobacteriales bacterium]
MITKILAAVLMITMVSCVDDNKGKAADEQPAAATPDTNQTPEQGLKQCYASLTTNDTVVLSFVVADTMVTGDLLYQFNEKDRNTGSIKGVLKGDTLIADYSFMSEGIKSVRQVVFLKQGDEMIEGFGYVAEDKGRMFYKDLKTLTFDKSVILKSVNCDNVPSLQ